MKTTKIKKLITELEKRHLTIGCAESFTGGLFSSTLVSVPGCSSVYKGGIVCYSKEAKEKFLNIQKNFINKYDVVSKEVAEAMAKNLKKILGVDIAVSFTGNAGPSKEEGKAEVGTVYIGISYKNKTDIYKKFYKTNRENIRFNAVNFAFDKILQKDFLSKFKTFTN